MECGRERDKGDFPTVGQCSREEKDRKLYEGDETMLRGEKEVGKNRGRLRAERGKQRWGERVRLIEWEKGWKRSDLIMYT